MGLFGSIHNLVFKDDGILRRLMDVNINAFVVLHQLFGDDNGLVNNLGKPSCIEELPDKSLQHSVVAIRGVLSQDASQYTAVRILIGSDGIHDVHVVRQIGLQSLLEVNELMCCVDIVDFHYAYKDTKLF